jgi:hypothetical protein
MIDSILIEWAETPNLDCITLSKSRPEFDLKSSEQYDLILINFLRRLAYSRRHSSLLHFL